MSGAINFNGTFAEANLQAEFYHHCRLLGIACLLEFSTPVGRHDLVVFSNDFQILHAIIECKRGHAFDLNSMQYRRYQKVGVPIFSLCKITDAEPLAREIQKLTTGINVSELYKIERVKRGRRRRRYLELDPDLIIRY